MNVRPSLFQGNFFFRKCFPHILVFGAAEITNCTLIEYKYLNKKLREHYKKTNTSYSGKKKKKKHTYLFFYGILHFVVQHTMIQVHASMTVS